MRYELQSINTESISDWAHESHYGRQGHASTNAPKPCRPTNYKQRRLNRQHCHGQNHCTKAPRPAPICAPRGGHRYNPRPGPRRHHLTHAAGMGHTSPQRRHQHKARAMSHAHGPQPPHIIRHKPKPPCHVSMRYKAGWLYFLSWQNLEAGPNGIRTLRQSKDINKSNIKEYQQNISRLSQ